MSVDTKLVRKYVEEIWPLVNQRNALNKIIARRQSEICKRLGVRLIAWIGFMKYLRLKHDTREEVLEDTTALMLATKDWVPPSATPKLTAKVIRARLK